jgi:hypothetical protein
VDRDDARARQSERQRVLEVPQGGAETAEQARQRQRHPQLLRRGRELDGLDPRRDELGMPGDGSDPQARVGRERRQLAEEVEHVGLVARSAAAENVGVDDHERHASSRQTRTTASATASQE